MARQPRMIQPHFRPRELHRSLRLTFPTPPVCLIPCREGKRGRTREGGRRKSTRSLSEATINTARTGFSSSSSSSRREQRRRFERTRKNTSRKPRRGLNSRERYQSNPKHALARLRPYQHCSTSIPTTSSVQLCV